MIYFGVKLIGGVLTLFFVAMYFALMAIVWAISVACAGIVAFSMAVFLYFTDNKPSPKVNKVKKPVSVKGMLTKQPDEVTLNEYTYVFKGNNLVQVRKSQ